MQTLPPFIRRSISLCAGVALVALAAALPAQAATNLFVNASFETPRVNYQELSGGSTVITGWTTVLSGVEHFNVAANGVGAAADGVMAVDLANFTFLTGGGLEQAVATGATMAWAVRSFSFVASGSSTVIRFWNDQNPNLYFADIDAVSVAASVPEAHSWAMLAAGLAAIGACVRRRQA